MWIDSDTSLKQIYFTSPTLQDPIRDYRLPAMNKQLSNWFDVIVVTRKREDISNLLKKLVQRDNPEILPLPDIPLPTLNGKWTVNNRITKCGNYFSSFFFFEGEVIETEDAYNETDEMGEFEEEELEEEEVKMISILWRTSAIHWLTFFSAKMVWVREHRHRKKILPTGKKQMEPELYCEDHTMKMQNIWLPKNQNLINLMSSKIATKFQWISFNFYRHMKLFIVCNFLFYISDDASQNNITSYTSRPISCSICFCLHWSAVPCMYIIFNTDKRRMCAPAGIM